MFANPLGLIALLAVPAVVALHLLRRRYQPRVVSALFLWEERERDPSEGRRWDRLRATLSLVLESLAALLLALALASPRGCEERGEHRVWVLDDSASMGAVDTAGRSPAEDAREALIERLSGLGSRDRVSLIATGPEPRLLAGPEAPADAVEDALLAWRPEGPDADPARALALARALSDGGGLLYATDAPLPEPGPTPDLDLLALGRPLDNVGFTDAARAGGRVELTLRSFAGEPVAGQVLGGSAPLPFRLDPGGTQRLGLEAPDDARLSLRLAREDGSAWRDGLALDDQVALAPPPDRALHLGSALPGAMNRALGLTRAADGAGLERWVAAVPESEAVAPEQADLLLTLDAQVPAGAWGLRISGPPTPEAPSEERALLGPFLATGHALLRGWSGEDLLWTPGVAVAAGPEDQPLLLAGTRALLLAHPEGEAIRFTLDIDPWRSTLARSADWPLLLGNLAELRRATLPGPARTNLRLGEDVLWRGAGAGEATLTGPSGERTLACAGDLLLTGLGPGVHELRPPEGEARALAVNLLSAAESDLRTRGEARVPADLPGVTTTGASAAAAGLGLGALLLLLLDWTLLGRRSG